MIIIIIFLIPVIYLNVSYLSAVSYMNRQYFLAHIRFSSSIGRCKVIGTDLADTLLKDVIIDRWRETNRQTNFHLVTVRSN